MMVKEDFYIRRMHVKIPIPSTVRALQKLISFTPQMFEWREAVYRLVKNIESSFDELLLIK